MTIYGYCRISTNKQNIERQVRNILREYPSAVIIKETYTGTKAARPEFTKLLNHVHAGDMIVFDSVSRMSRNAEDGWNLYKRLYDDGIELAFIKEPTINTATYRAALNKAVPMTGGAVDTILRGVNEYLCILAEQQVKIAFDQAQKEVDDLRQRTKEGIETARLNGEQIGRETGKTYTTKKEVEAKEKILKHAQTFGGTLNDTELIQMIGISRGSYYKYKRELISEMEKASV